MEAPRVPSRAETVERLQSAIESALARMHRLEARHLDRIDRLTRKIHEAVRDEREFRSRATRSQARRHCGKKISIERINPDECAG